VDQIKGSLTPNLADQQTPQMIYGNPPKKLLYQHERIKTIWSLHKCGALLFWYLIVGPRFSILAHGRVPERQKRKTQVTLKWSTPKTRLCLHWP